MNNVQLARLVAMFKSEAGEHIASINQQLLALERAPEGEVQTERLTEIFRAAHSLKGAARTVGFTQIETLAHEVESVLGAARSGELELTPQVCDDLYRTLDKITDILKNSQAVEQAQTGHTGDQDAPDSSDYSALKPKDTSLRSVTSASGSETIRVSIAKLEALMAQASELLIFKITAEQRLADVRQLRQDMKRKRKSMQNGHSTEPASHGAWFSDMYNRLALLEHHLTNDTLRLGMVIENVQDNIRQTRMLPFNTITAGFQRLVRDLAHKLSKTVILKIEGAGTEIDRKILEDVRDPIIHLLGNAVDHGIETPEERSRLGKAAEGFVLLAFRQTGNSITITIEDDGCGLNLPALKEAALRSGIYTEHDLAGMSAAEVTQLAFLPGITTHPEVTRVSGRGVGLDVVRHKLEALHGQIEIQTEQGLGTRFVLTVPLTLATTRGLLIRLAEEIYAIPVSAISKIVIAQSSDVQTINGHEVISVNGVPTALVHLSELVGLPVSYYSASNHLRCVVLHAGETQIAFVVDEFVGEQELVLKSLGKQLERVPNIAGATLLGTGDIVIILNPVDLIRLAQGKSTHTPIIASSDKDAQPQPTILVVDDSITTRTLEKNILETAGYRVVTAMDGIEALRYLQYNNCDLVVSDIQMPQMDGFELTQSIRKNSTLNHLPLILVTSLESQADRERGLTAGANAYVIKSGFNQDNLLSIIRQLL